MLLEFKAQNYKSFKDEFTFSLIPNEKVNELSYSILKKKIGRKTYKGLSSAVVYGANASGKSNIISAIHTFQQIILRGNIENAKQQDPDIAAYRLDLIPNCSFQEPKPVYFSITFIAEQLLITYESKIDLSIFSDEEIKNRKILFEKLTINNKEIFVRTDTIEIQNLDTLIDFFDEKFEKIKDQANILAQNNLSEQNLFLTNGFKNIYSNKLVEIIINWIKDKLIILFQVDKLEAVPTNLELAQNEVAVDYIANDSGKIIGITSDILGYKKQKDEPESKLYSFVTISNKRIGIPAKHFESYGTLRFLNLLPSLTTTFISGGTLIIDEFDASLHPMILMNIINIFHNDEINKNKAQLIFNTHNPIFLNANFFRRDEIKFVEKDDEGFSSHYSLSDFDIAKSRTPDIYMTNYFINKYGAIKRIDFSDLFEKIINNMDEK